MQQEGQCRSMSRFHLCPIASTMNEPMFNMVISKWHNDFDTLRETNDLKSLTKAKQDPW